MDLQSYSFSIRSKNNLIHTYKQNSGSRRCTPFWRVLKGAVRRRTVIAIGFVGKFFIHPLYYTVRFLAISTALAFQPKLAVVMTGTLLLAGAKGSNNMLSMVSGVVQGPFLVLVGMRVVLPWSFPGLWRSLVYWQRLLPIMFSYFNTHVRAKRACGLNLTDRVHELWQEQHEFASESIFEVFSDLKGFYLKLGQILATKTDMLPAPYTSSLARLLDKLPPMPFKRVQCGIERQLGGQLSKYFVDMDTFPLASATIAQVHRAQLASAYGSHEVVVKVQHRGTKRMMSSDLSNMRIGCRILDALNVKLGFDLTSVVLEYCEQVPLEFNFRREAANAAAIREALHAHCAELPLLNRVVIPKVYPMLSTDQILVMEYVDGVPILDVALMELELKTELVSALVLAYGVMILRTGLFHSDPHPGNLLACCKNDAQRDPVATTQMTQSMNGSLHPLVNIALIDFGQVKELTDAARLKFSLLVCAMASRDNDLVIQVMKDVGLVVENCSLEFQAIAGYILFDTRMDFPEAHESPLDPNANEGWRCAKVPSLPQDLFMVVRVITLLRGVMSSLGVDVSSSLMWRPLAMQTIAELGGEFVK